MRVSGDYRRITDGPTGFLSQLKRIGRLLVWILWIKHVCLHGKPPGYIGRESKNYEPTQMVGLLVGSSNYSFCIFILYYVNAESDDQGLSHSNQDDEGTWVRNE